MKRIGLIVAALTALLICTLVIGRKTELAFDSVLEARNLIGAAGFHCISDRSDGICHRGFLVSRVPGTWEEVCRLNKSFPAGPEWKGKVWVTVNSSVWLFEFVPDNAASRTWGKVTAFGDSELLEKIEEAVQSERRARSMW